MSIEISLLTYQTNNQYLEVNENQTAIIPLTIIGPNSEILTPSVLRWQLTDKQGNIINNRSFSDIQVITDKIILGYDDTTIINDENEMLLSIAAGVIVDGVNYQQNAEVLITIKDFVNTYPNLFATNLDTPFEDLDTPFTDLDEPF